MDEPLASLDEARKAEILPYIERLRDESGVPIVYVSHSVAEVARLASTIVLLSEGRSRPSGPTAEIMQRLDLFPLTGRAEAGAVIEATVERHDDALRPDGAALARRDCGGCRGSIGTGRTRVRLRVRARDVMLATSGAGGAERAQRPARRRRRYRSGRGPRRRGAPRLQRRRAARRLTRYSVERLGLARGQPGLCPDQERRARPPQPQRPARHRARSRCGCEQRSIQRRAGGWTIIGCVLSSRTRCGRIISNGYDR